MSVFASGLVDRYGNLNIIITAVGSMGQFMIVPFSQTLLAAVMHLRIQEKAVGRFANKKISSS